MSDEHRQNASFDGLPEADAVRTFDELGRIVRIEWIAPTELARWTTFGPYQIHDCDPDALDQ